MKNELAELQVFAKVVTTGSFSSAARELRRTPSSVSKLIQRMEERLGVKLFNRNSRSLKLTDDGRHIYRIGSKALDAMTEFSNLASVKALRVGGVLRINTLLTFAIYQIVPLLPEFHQRFPDIRLEFILGPDPLNIIEKDIDVAIHLGSPADSQLICRTIAHTRWIICAAPSYLASSGAPMSPGELSQHKCLNFTIRDEWNRWPLRGKPAKFSIEPGPFATNQGEMMLALARQGLGIVRLAHYHVARDLREGRLVPLLEDYNRSDSDPICLVYQSRKNLSPRLRCFRDFLLEKFSGEAPWLA